MGERRANPGPHLPEMTWWTTADVECDTAIPQQGYAIGEEQLPDGSWMCRLYLDGKLVHEEPRALQWIDDDGPLFRLFAEDR